MYPGRQLRPASLRRVTRWEYKRVSALVKRPSIPGGGLPTDLEKRCQSVLAEVHLKWVETVNQLGSDGWELVHYEFVNQSYADFSVAAWAEYAGMMKRPLSESLPSGPEATA